MHRPRRGARSAGRARGRARRYRRAARLGKLARQAMTWQPRTLEAFLSHAAETRGDAEALVTQHSRLTFTQLYEQAQKAAGGLQSLGLQRGDHIGILMGNDDKWLS